MDVAASDERRVVSSAVYVPSHHGEATRQWPVDQRRGIHAMYTVIATEFSLFVCLFASYYYLGSNKTQWPIDQPPKMHLALIMLAVLLTSSVVLHWGEGQLKRAKAETARIAIGATTLIGIVFMVLQSFEYRDHWKALTPFSDSYASIFYTITSFHALHVVVGILLLGYVALLPQYGPTVAPPCRPYRTVALYWHFVDIVWIFIVVFLYIVPNMQA
jgi:heme/copper-type cytochrome/quinol oxidase subunit 3